MQPTKFELVINPTRQRRSASKFCPPCSAAQRPLAGQLGAGDDGCRAANGVFRLGRDLFALSSICWLLGLTLFKPPSRCQRM
jgi:hypothetical protein